MRALLAFVLVAVAAAAAWWILRPSTASAPPLPPAEPLGAPAERSAGTPPPAGTEADTGVLVVRVKTNDGKPLPPKTQAGFERQGGARLRAVAEDGSARFPDAPVGRVNATAEAEGYVAVPVAVVVVAGVPAEAVVTLAPRER